MSTTISKIVGFSVVRGDGSERAARAEARVLESFPWLRRHSIEAGPDRVTVWGHGELTAFLHVDPTGTTWLLSNANVAPSWTRIVEAYERDRATVSRAVGLEGIFVLVRLGVDEVELWNDWTGASKVYTWSGAKGHGASTLEPVAVAAADAGEADVSPSALFSLMRFGVFVGITTLYRSLQLHAPESYGRLTRRGLQTRRIHAIDPTDTRWSAGWDEVIEEWKALLEETFTEALRPVEASTLMLSGGIDSRLIAAIGKAAGHRFDAVSYGNRVWQDGIVAAKVAEALGLPITFYPIGTDYLTRYTKPWCDWFGSSMSVHGMYQMPALVALRAEGRTAPITTGFTGDPLEGMQIELLMRKVPGDTGTLLERLARKFVHWSEEEIARLLPDLDVGAARDELEANLQAQFATFPGADFQKMWLLFQWNRVFQFSSYQPTMYEYFTGAITPFVSSRLANFTLSLPRYALERRRTILEMIKAHYPQLAQLPGTYDHPTRNFEFIPARYGLPLLLTKRYLAKAAIGYAMPERLRRGPLREFAPGDNVFARDAVRADALRALYPLDRVTAAEQSWFDPTELGKQVQAVLADQGLYASARLWPIQTILHRFVAGDR